VTPVLRPPALQPGDTIALVSPSRPGDPATGEKAIAYIERQGYQVQVLDGGRRQPYHYLAGRDSERAAQVMNAFTDDSIRALVCMRGGYGSGRILDLLDYDLIAQNPKPMVGFSDSTGLHLALYARCGLVGLTGALADTDLGLSSPPPRTTRTLWHLLTQSSPLGMVSPDSTCLRSGTASGALIPVNLALLCSLLGTPFQPDLAGKILLVEDVWEAPYRLDRMFTQLRLAGILDTIAGLALGAFTKCFVPEEMANSPDLEEIVLDAMGDRNVPVLSGIGYGHMPDRLVLPMGVASRLDASAGQLTILEPAVDVS
jgi:muramoyltetrapeptide carboxypeptidase